MPRTFAPNQSANLIVLTVKTCEQQVVFSSDTLLFEAPNWTTDDKWLIFNGDGHLFRIGTSGGDPEQINLGDVPAINNDHVVSPDGKTIYVSSDDGHLYAVAADGSEQRRVTNDHGPSFRHYLHGLSPDGLTLAYIGLRSNDDGTNTTNVYTIPTAGGGDIQITDDEFADDGSEFSQDGAWIYFNSERAAKGVPGHAQLFRITRDGAIVEQLTDDERVNWFPHPSPIDDTIAYISFPPGTLGHPADKDVVIRLLEADGTHRDLAAFFGGQGTMNVPSWSPDGTRIAFVEYPIAD